MRPRPSASTVITHARPRAKAPASRFERCAQQEDPTSVASDTASHPLCGRPVPWRHPRSPAVESVPTRGRSRLADRRRARAKKRAKIVDSHAHSQSLARRQRRGATRARRAPMRAPPTRLLTSVSVIVAILGSVACGNGSPQQPADRRCQFVDQADAYMSEDEKGADRPSGARCAELWLSKSSCSMRSSHCGDRRRLRRR